jgi:hypothetical protein
VSHLHGRFGTPAIRLMRSIALAAPPD